MLFEKLRNPIVLLTGGFLLTALLTLSVYTNFISPLKVDKKTLIQNLQTEKTLIANMKADMQETEVNNAKRTIELQGKVPTKPLVGQFFLSLEKAEVISDSLILNMNISEQGVGEEAEEDGVKRITVALEVISPNYYALETFIKSIENQKRITTIDSIIFAGKQEGLNLEEDELRYDIIVSTYYTPQYREYISHIPFSNYPQVGTKENPLFSNVFKGEEAKVHEVITRHIYALNQQDVIALMETVHVETEQDNVVALASSLSSEVLKYEVLQLSIENLSNREANARYIYKVTDVNDESSLIEGMYSLQKQLGEWKIFDMYVEQEVKLENE